jgi:hypothetical protein
MALLDDIKTLLGISDISRDDLLNIYIRKAKTLITTYLQIPTEAYTDYTGTVIEPIDVTVNYPDACIEYAIECYRKKGNEGVKSFGQGSRSGTYEDGLSESVKSLLPSPYIKMMGVSR